MKLYVGFGKGRFIFFGGSECLSTVWFVKEAIKEEDEDDDDDDY